MNLPNSRQKLIILGLVLLAFLLRAYRLDFQSYWIDEAWTVFFAKLPLGELLSYLNTVEPHPAFYHPSTMYWLHLVGDSEYAMRFYSLLFGVLAVPLTYRFGTDLGDDRLGLVAALLMTVAPYQIWHSQEARMYSLLTATSLLSMWGFVNLLRRGGWRWWLLYVFGTLWTISSHYHGLMLIGVQGLFLLLTWRRHRQRYLTWARALTLIFLLYLPWLIFSWDLLRNRTNWVEQIPLWDTYLRGAIAYSLGELVLRPQAIPLVLVFVATYGFGLIYATRRRWGQWHGPEMLAFLLAYTIVPNFAAWLYGELRATAYLERYLIPVQVGFLLTVSMGILALADFGYFGFAQYRFWILDFRQRQGAKEKSPLSLSPAAPLRSGQIKWVGYSIATALLLLLVSINGWVLKHHYFDPNYAKPDWRSVTQTIEDFGLPGDAIVLTGDGGEKVFNLYYQGELPIYFSFNNPVPPEEEARQIIADIAETHHRVWYTAYGTDIDTILENWLANNAYPAWHRWLGRKQLALYRTNNTILNRQESLNDSFVNAQGQRLTLGSVALPDETIPAGDLLPLALTWQTETPLTYDYQLSLRLINVHGDIFAQSDWPPLAGTGGTSSWLPQQPVTDRRSLWIPSDTPPDNYALQFVVYNPSSGQALDKPDSLFNVDISAAETVVPLDALPRPNPTKQTLDGLTLVGYDLPATLQPGQNMWLWLYWQAQRTPEPETKLRLSLSDESETVTAEFPFVDSVGPLDSWLPGQVRRAVYHFPTSPHLTGGQGQVGLALVSSSGRVKAEATLAQIALATRSRQFEPPAVTYATDIALGQTPFLKLIGYDLPTTNFAPGDTIPITLYWQAVAEMDVNYTVFVQLLDSANQVVAQADLQPQAGAAPTTTWLPGEILADPYSLPLPDLPSGTYRLTSGLYDAATGERLPVATGGDFLELSQIRVK